MLQSGYDNVCGTCENVSKRYVTAAVFTEKCLKRPVFDYTLKKKRNTQYIAISHCQLITMLVQLTTLYIFVRSVRGYRLIKIKVIDCGH